MHYAGCASLLLCGTLVVLLWAALSFVTASERPAQRSHLPAWALGAGILAIAVAVLALRKFSPDANQVTEATLVAGTMIAGVFAKWTLEIAADKPRSLHEASLAASLLVAPLCALALGDRVFAAALRPGALLLWFANGFFWQTLFSDIVRMRTPLRVIVRRKEP
jgi:hypothetical protein